MPRRLAAPHSRARFTTGLDASFRGHGAPRAVFAARVTVGVCVRASDVKLVSRAQRLHAGGGEFSKGFCFLSLGWKIVTR